VQCTVATEALCAGNSCNPATKTCTTTPIGTKSDCEPCVADSECVGGDQADPEMRCVPMTYAGVPRPGGFCLRRLAKTCERPFSIRITQASLSGASREDFCGINEQTTKCEAILDLLRSSTCPGMTDSECGCQRNQQKNCVGAGETGLCRMVGALSNRCTYRCGIRDDCPEGLTCSATSPKYCR
jgi:hypothetical protein